MELLKVYLLFYIIVLFFLWAKYTTHFKLYYYHSLFILFILRSLTLNASLYYYLQICIILYCICCTSASILCCLVQHCTGYLNYWSHCRSCKVIHLAISLLHQRQGGATRRSLSGIVLLVLLWKIYNLMRAW